MDDELRHLFERLTRVEEQSGAAAECTPPLDVVETSDGVEIMMDLPGVAADHIQVVVARNTLVIMGRKMPPGCAHQREAAFHIAERGFGRFARAVRLSGAFDVARGAATLRDGELRVTLSRIEDRRGREHRLPIRIE